MGTLDKRTFSWSSADSLLVGVVPPTPVIARPSPDPFTTVDPLTDDNAVGLFATEVASQEGDIVEMPGLTKVVGDINPSNTEDELRMGLRYVQALGADTEPEGTDSPMSSSSAGVSLFSSASRSTIGESSEYLSAKRVVVIPGQEFKFFVRIPPVSVGARAQGMDTPAIAAVHHEHGVKIISGRTLSRLHVDLNEVETRGVAKITGESKREDIGVVALGVYAGWDYEVCLAVIIIEVAETR